MRRRIVINWYLVGLMTIGLMSGCKSESNGTQSVSIYDRLQQAREIEDPLERATELIAIGNEYTETADALGARNSLNDAVLAAEEVKVKTQAGDRARIHVSLAEAWRTAGDSGACEDAYEEAEEALEEVEEPAEKTGILIDLALLKVKIDDKGAAAKDLSSAEKLSADIGDPYERIDMLAWVTYGYVQLQDKDEAKRVMESAAAFAEGKDSAGEKGRLLAVVGREQVNSLEDREAGMATLAKALETARAIPDNKNLQANVMVDIAENLFKVGDAAKAKEVLNEAEELVQGRSEGKPVLQKIEALRKQY